MRPNWFLGVVWNYVVGYSEHQSKRDPAIEHLFCHPDSLGGVQEFPKYEER